MTMRDGSRLFAALPESRSWDELRRYLGALPGAQVTNFVSDQVFEVWIDFTYSGQRFSVNNPYGEYWFFVDDRTCPEPILRVVVDHCAPFLEPLEIDRHSPNQAPESG